MVTVQKSFAEIMRKQMESEAEARYGLEQRRMEWLVDYRAAHPEQKLSPPRTHPVWVSLDGATCVAVNYKREDTRVAAIERVARKIARTTQDLQFGWEFSRCDGAFFLRHHGWKLLPDDDGQVMA